MKKRTTGKKYGLHRERRIYPFWQAAAWILGSVVVIQAVVWTSYSVYLMRQYAFHRPLLGILQNCTSSDALRSEYLLETLHLSKGKNLLCCDVDSAALTAQLKNCPVVESAHISIVEPPYLEVNYSLRSPVAYVKDVENGALDEKGVLIPFAPFYFPKVLPSVILGKEKTQWKWADSIAPQKHAAFSEIHSLFKNSNFPHWKLVAVDLSRLEEASLARQEVIAILQNQEYENPSLFFIRLTHSSLRKSLEHFFASFATEKLFDFEEKFYVVDMRHPDALLWNTF